VLSLLRERRGERELKEKEEAKQTGI